ncbi:MAG: PAS domain S-box protein [Steroidobacteraceae bacterium]
MKGELQALLDACVDAVIIIDHRGLITTFSAAACRMFGYRGDEVSGRNVSVLMTEPDASQHDEYLRHHLLSGETRVIGVGREVTARRRDGSVFPASLAVGRIADSKPARFVGFLHDLTPRRREEEQRRNAEQAVREARERLTHVSRLSTLGEMTTGLSHELNQPLTAIATYARAAERMAEQPQPQLDEVVSALRQISAQALRAGEIIKRLRTLVRNREVQEELLELNSVVRELVVLAESDARLNNVQLQIELAPDLPPVLGDAVQLQQVMLNLLRNAIDAVSGLDDAARTIVLRTIPVADQVELSVTDSGRGIDPAIRERLFEAFVTTKPEGTGLGLAISRSIAENHGGKLAWRANQPCGSCFYLTLPAVSGEPL